MKHLNLIILALFLTISSFAQVGPISGPDSLCTGSSATFTDPTPGGTWSCLSTILSIAPATGVAIGVSSGTTIITYTVGTHDTTYFVNVFPTPSPFTGPASVCPGSTVIDTEAMPTGTWTIAPLTVATMVPYSLAAAITGVSPGMATLSYTSPHGCSVSRVITVNVLPTPITGATSVCMGTTTTLSDATPGGTWSSSSPAVASISPTGVITGISHGYSNISYILPTGCFSLSSMSVDTIVVYTLMGGGSYCIGGPGVHIILNGSQPGFTYTLYHGSTPVNTVIGTGASLDFGLISTVGTYTAVVNPGTSCATTMSGTITIGTIPLPTSYTVGLVFTLPCLDLLLVSVTNYTLEQVYGVPQLQAQVALLILERLLPLAHIP